MDLNRKSSEFIIDLDQEEDAAGLYAVLSGNPTSVPPHVFAKGQQIYAWFFQEVAQLATYYKKETEVVYAKTKPKKW